MAEWLLREFGKGAATELHVQRMTREVLVLQVRISLDCAIYEEESYSNMSVTIKQRALYIWNVDDKKLKGGYVP